MAGTRRQLLTAAGFAAAATTLGLTACNGSSAGSTPDGKAALQFTWW